MDKNGNVYFNEDRDIEELISVQFTFMNIYDGFMRTIGYTNIINDYDEFLSWITPYP